MSDASIQTILIVDDSSENLAVLSGLLDPSFRVRAANSGKNALRISVTDPRPELILLDVMMPEMDGFEVIKQLKNNPATADIPVIFITAMDNIETEIRGLNMGAVDFITKPIIPQIVLTRVRTQLELKKARDILKNHNNFLETEVEKRVAENELIQEISIRALAHLAEIRDTETGNHILRTQFYVQKLAKLLQKLPRFTGKLDDHYIKMIARSAPLHDIGKVGIPDAILLKPGPLTPEEWVIMKTHAKLGSDAIEKAEHDTDLQVEFLTLAKEIAHWHHEKWNGSGYPDGLIGDDIPISARIMALADVFDALISRRVYKKAMTIDEVKRIILEGRGQHFDPDMVDVLLNNIDDFCAIANQYRDPDPE